MRFVNTCVESLEPRRLLAGNITPDTTFGGDGFVTVPAFTAALSDVIDLAGAPGGKVVAIASGAGREVIRYNTDGSVDESFGVDGRFLLAFDATAIDSTTDGSIVIAGTNTVLRLTPDGDTDDDFGAGGIVVMPANGAIVSTAADVRVDAGGDITVLRNGTLDRLSTDSTPVAVLTYLNHDGSLNSSSTANGTRVIRLPVTVAGIAEFQDMSLADDGGVFIGGRAFQFGAIAVAHLSSTGVIDPNFQLRLETDRVSNLAGMATDNFGNIALLTATSLGRTTVSLFDAAGEELDQLELRTPFVVVSPTALGMGKDDAILIGFDPYAVARLVTGQVAPGVFLDETGVLQVIGSAGDDVITVNRYDSSTLRVTRNGRRILIDRSEVTQIVLAGNAGNDALTVTVDIPVVATGDLGDDAITTAGADDRIAGGDGNDSLIANGGKDVLTGGVGADRLWGGSGKDRLAGEGGKDKLYGGSGDDQLDGGASDDLLYGEAGNDKLFGGRGNDILDGGSGANEFFPGEGDDTIIQSGVPI